MNRVFLVDDSPVFREGLKAVLASHHDLMVCGEASLSQVAEKRPGFSGADLLLVDFTAPAGDRLDLIPEFLDQVPRARILLCTARDDAVSAERALVVGAHGLVSKRAELSEIIVAARRVLTGEIYLSDEVRQAVLNRLFQIRTNHAAAEDPIGTLSRRELQVFQLIGQGRTTQEIAVELQMSDKTVHSHRMRIRAKLGLPSAARLTSEASKWVHGPSSSSAAAHQSDPSEHPQPVLRRPLRRAVPGTVQGSGSIAQNP